MASFVHNLWDSIFTPGPTPTLLLATNVTFAALQLVLFALLVATASVHFVILSFLSGGLWWAINWFARELTLHQQQEAEKDRKAKETPIGQGSGDDSETEVEGSSSGINKGGRGVTIVGGTEVDSGVREESGSNEVEVVQRRGELKQRVAAAGEDSSQSQGRKSSVSTEDEWEKVSESENDKDK